MKKIYILLASTFILASCGNNSEKTTVESVIASGNTSEIISKKKEIEEQAAILTAQLETLNSALAKLDTVKKLSLVTSLLVESEEYNHYFELQGNVSTKQNVLIYPEMPGILERIYVKEGQTVKKGTVLARINDGGLSNQLGQLEAQEKLSKTIFEKQKRLWAQKIGSEVDFLRAETNYLALKNNVAQLKSQIAKTTIVAPFSGTIDDVIKEEGTVIAPGQGSEVFRIINLNNMYIDAEVPESYVGKIKKGNSVEVYFPILGETVKTSITHAGNFINASNRSFNVEIAIPNKDGKIKPNLTSKVKINDYKNPSAILIPQSIISEDADGEQYIYTVSNKNSSNEAVVNRTFIKTGKTQGDIIEVIDGLKNGMEIIVEGARSVNNGQVVKIIN